MSDEAELDKVFLLLENRKKSNNLGPILRCASAFGVKSVVVVGFSICSVEGMLRNSQSIKLTGEFAAGSHHIIPGSHGASKHVEIIAFPNVQQAISFLSVECLCQSIVGLLGCCPDGYNDSGLPVVEMNGMFEARGPARDHKNIDEIDTCTVRQSFSVSARPFRPGGHVCFALGKDRSGLPSELALHCTHFVHVPHASLLEANSPPLLDSPTCLSITLHHFTSWSRYDERGFYGHKFNVSSLRPDLAFSAQKSQNRLRNRLLKEKASEDALEEGVFGILFDEDVDENGLHHSLDAGGSPR